MEAKPRLEWLDALRGWAVFLVVVVHSGISADATGWARSLSSAGQYGVQLFFLVSALTIGITYDAHVAKHGANLRTDLSWLIKRLFRIAPLYFAAIAFYSAQKVALHHGAVSIPDVICNATFIHTWVPSANNSVVPGGWSIGVEMAFYVMVPLLWAIPSATQRFVVMLTLVPLSLAVTHFVAWRQTGSLHVGNNTYLYFWFPTQYVVFAIGLSYYMGVLRRDRDVRIPANLFAAIFLPLFVLGAWLGVTERAPSLSPLLVGLAFVCLVVGIQGPLGRVVVCGSASFLGRVSFSVYILHFFVLDCLRGGLRYAHVSLSPTIGWMVFACIALVITSLAAIVSKRLVEDPGIAIGSRLAARVLRRR